MKKLVLRLFVVAKALSPALCLADGAFVTADGINRAPAMTLHCATQGMSAGPCGVAANPLVVAPIPGGSTATNQQTEINAAQATSATVGSAADAAYTGGAGSLVALLKAMTGSLSSGVVAVPAGGTPASRSTTLAAQQSTILFPVNASRRYFSFQAPQSSYVWVNMVGGPATPNCQDCVYFPAGTFYESGPYVNRGTISVYAPIIVAIAAWEG